MYKHNEFEIIGFVLYRSDVMFSMVFFKAQIVFLLYINLHQGPTFFFDRKMLIQILQIHSELYKETVRNSQVQPYWVAHPSVDV